MNIIDFALKMELEGMDYYRKLAAGSSVDYVRDTFAALVQAEQRHYDLIQGLRSNPEYSGAASAELEQVETVFARLQRNAPLGGDVPFDRDGYRRAIQAEEESIQLYQGAADKEPDVAAAELFRKLAGEETRHLEMVAALYEHMEAPRTFLEWREFSNLNRL